MFGNDSKPSKIYAYKARTPVVGAERFNDQAFRAHRYRNKLAEIDLRRRKAVNDALLACVPEMGRLLESEAVAIAEYERIDTELRQKNARARSRVATPEDRERKKVATKAMKEARASLKEARATAFADPRVKEALRITTEESKKARKEARKDSGLYWGNYLRVEQAAQSMGKGAPPRFLRWNHEGTVSVQLQKGRSWEQITDEGDTKFRVVVRPPTAAADPRSRRSRETPMADAWIRVGSDGRDPIWAVVPFRLHRRPPEDSQIKWVHLYRRIVGCRVCWELQLVVSRDSWEREDSAADGEAGLDVNWRITPNGLRVAYLVGDDGRERTLTIPREVMTGWSKSESLQSIRDRAFDEARIKMTSWISGKSKTALPEAFLARFAYLGLWKSCDKFDRAIWWWRENRVPGDDVIFAEMQAWRKKDRHLHQWQDDQRRKSIRKRNELYRRFVAIAHREYRTVRIEDTNWRELARNPGPEDPSDAVFKQYARVASVGTLLEYLREAVAEAPKRPAKDTTRRCHVCGSVEIFDAGQELFHTCVQCGTLWDQDRNAAINLMRGPDAVGPFPQPPDYGDGDRDAPRHDRDGADQTEVATAAGMVA